MLAAAIGAVSLGLVRGSDWGWGSATTIATFAAAALGVAGFWRRSLRHPLPIIEPALLRVRAFAWSNVHVPVLLGGIRRRPARRDPGQQGVWHYSALRTGLAIAPGPVMVPIFVALHHRFASRVRPGRVAALGNVTFAIGNIFLLTRLGERRST